MFFSCLKDHSTKKLGSWAKKCVLQPANGRTDGQTDTHESVKSVKMQISKNKNMCIFLMSQVSLNSKIRFLSQKVCPVARSQTDRHTDRVTTEGTLSGFHDFFLQPIIKDRPKMHFFLMFQGSFNPPKDRFLGQKVCPVASEQTDTQTHTHTRK